MLTAGHHHPSRQPAATVSSGFPLETVGHRNSECCGDSMISEVSESAGWSAGFGPKSTKLCKVTSNLHLQVTSVLWLFDALFNLSCAATLHFRLEPDQFVSSAAGLFVLATEQLVFVFVSWSRAKNAIFFCSRFRQDPQAFGRILQLRHGKFKCRLGPFCFFWVSAAASSPVESPLTQRAILFRR